MEKRISAEQLLSILDSFDEGIYITDKEGITLAVNSSYERMTGIRRENVLGRHVQDLVKGGILSQSITNRVISERKDAVTGQTVFAGGQRRNVLLHGKPVFDKNGDIGHVVTFVRDVTAINQMQKKLAQQEELVSRYRKQLQEQTGERPPFIEGTGAFKKAVDLARRVASVDSTVLILGESGTGKEVIAQEIHRKSLRKEETFLEINCGAVPENLLESELFGYVGGAFTGADRRGHKGMFEEASEGTLFLDEVGDMPPYLQVKLLKVLQEHVITPLGSTKPVPIHTRIIAATNKDLAQMVREKTFREDLYYRLNIVAIRTPPLRERKEDIPELTEYFVDKINSKYDLNKKLSPDILSAFLAYDWPGNVRELENIIERIMVTTSQDLIRPADCMPFAEGILAVPAPDFGAKSMRSAGDYYAALHDLSLEEALENVEREMILYAAARYNSTYKMAKKLKISQSSASRKLRKYAEK